MITQSELKQLLDYNPDTGIFTWKVKKIGIKFIGSKAGTYDKDKYIQIKINQKIYRSHRLAWLYQYGIFPKFDLDHINGIKDDNRICNLREVTASQNMFNTKIKITNTSGIKGISWCKRDKRWIAHLSINKKQTHLGSFKDLKLAKNAVIEARNKYHKEFANHGNI